MLSLLLLACGPRLEEAPAADGWATEGHRLSDADLDLLGVYLLSLE